MKNLFTKMMLVAVAAMTFIGCSQEPAEINATVKKTTVELTANIDEVTRSYFGDEVTEGGVTSFPSLWEGNESVKLVAYGEADAVIAQAYGNVEAEEGSATARISATFEGELTGVVKLGAYVGGWSYTTPGVVEVPEEQSMNKEGTVASNAHTMSAEVAWDGTPASLELSFAHAVAYGRMQGKGLDDKTITKAVVTVDEAEYVVNISNELDTKYIWFACEANEDISTLDVAVTCSNNRTYVKTIDMTLAANPLKFRTGEVSKFAVSGLTEKPADYILNLNKISARTGNTITFQGDEENDQWNVIFNAGLTELVAGTYQGINGTDWSSADALEFDCFNSTFNVAANPSAYGGYYTQSSNEVINVSIEGGIYTIEAYWTSYVDGVKTVQLTYQGDLTVTKSTDCIVLGECNNAQMFALWLAEDQTAMDNDEYAYLYFRVPSSVYSVLPEGTYQYVDADNGDFIVNNWSRMYYNNENYKIQSATVTVQHLDAGYIIEAVVVDANNNEFSYYYEGTVESKNSWGLINNPPIPYKDITVEGAMATVTASYSEGVYYESYPEYSSGDTFTINFETEQIDGVAYSGSITLQVPIGEDTAGIIPAQTYSLTSDTYKISDGYADGYNFTSASLTVGHTATGYTLALTAENGMKTKFILSFEGAIAKDNEYNNFRNPGDAVKLDMPSNLNVTVDGTSATVTWDAVANADSYLVELVGTEDSYEISASATLTATFTGLEYESYYSINITARPEASSTLYKNSDVASTSFETGKDPNAQALVFTTAEYVMSGTDMVVTFSDGTNTLKLTYFANGATSFAAGTYVLSTNFSGWYSSFNGGQMQSCVVTVTGAPGATQTFDFVINDGTKDYEFSYVGELSVGVMEFGYAYVAYEYDSSKGYLVLSFADPGWNYYDLAFVTTGNYLEEKTYVIGTDIVLAASTTGIESGTVEVSYNESTSNYSFMISFVYNGDTIEGKYSGWLNLSAPM